jgi:subtilisin family serine protease
MYDCSCFLPRLIAQVPSQPEDVAQRTDSDLRGNPIPGVRHLAEMNDFLERRGVRDIWMARRLPSYHLLEVLDGDILGAIVRILRRYVSRTAGPGFVEQIEPDRRLEPSIPSVPLGTSFDLTKGQHAGYSIDLNLQDASQNGITGAGVTVAVVDSGAEPSVMQNPYSDFRDLIGNPPSATGIDNHGHGTAMMRIIQATAPGARVCAVRVFDQANPTLWDTLAGIRAAVVDFKADVINLSLGFLHLNFPCGVCGSHGANRSTTFEQSLAWIQQLGGQGGYPDPVFVAATGNDRSTTGFHYPAAYKDLTLAVGAINGSKERSSFSNYGTNKGFYVMLPGGDWDYNRNKASEWVGEGVDSHGNPTYCVGTSPAAAYASGLVALYREQFKRLSSKELLDRVILRCKTDLSPSHNRNEHGDGRLVFEYVTSGQGPASASNQTTRGTT